MLTKFNVVSFEVENSGATEDSHVLKLCLPDCGAVVRDEHKFGLAVPHGLHGSLVTYMGKRACKHGGVVRCTYRLDIFLI